jgi:RNA polymerase sigma factor (sigma-70 family)
VFEVMARAAAAGELIRARPARAEAEPAVVELLERHGGRLMSVARRYSNCREDAEDAYQRAVEILLLRAPSADPGDLLPWMKTVVKHEAFAVMKQRARHGTPSDAGEIEPHVGRAEGCEDVVERRERLRLGAEALGRLKPQEVRALLLRADGLSYREICAATGWTYTKVNRCLSEGRARFVDRVEGIERGAECERLRPLLSVAADGEASGEQVAELRPHLSGCLTCRARLREYRRAPSRAAAAVAPVGVLGALRWVLHGAAGQKAAVVAATVAVAGGGAAIVHDRPRAPARPAPDAGPSAPAAPRPRVAPAGSRPAPAGAVGGRRLDRQLRKAAPAGRSRGPQRGSGRSHAPARRPRAPTTGEFTPTPAPRAPPPRPAAPPRPARHRAPSPPGGEFAP